MNRISIIGAGISGLTVAYALLNSKNDVEVTVFESDTRTGGKIWSEKIGRFLCEKGPNGFLDNKPRTLELCKSLGIEPVRGNQNAKRRFIFLNKTLNLLPETPPSFLKSNILTWSGKLRILYELIAPRGPEDETVAQFVKRRLGTEALERLIDPMCSGIYAGDPYKMSIKSCFPRIKELEQEYGSLIRAMIKIRKQKKVEAAQKGSKENTEVSVAPAGVLTSFYNGAQTITDALTDRLGDRLRLSASVKGISRSKGAYQVELANENHSADVVIIATPAYTTADILQGLDEELSRILNQIPYPHLSVVCFGYKKEQVTHLLDGFGFLVPHVANRRILGTVWDSSIFPNRASEGYVLLRTMIGGAQAPEIISLDDDEIVRIVFDELKPTLGLKSVPEIVGVYRWDKAIPQYILGHAKILETIDERLKMYPGLYLTGNAYRGISMNDCVENGYALADKIMKSLT